MHVQPYLFFEGRTEEALAFYKKALGAEVMFKMHFKDSPVPAKENAEGCAPGEIDPNSVMHCSFRIGSSVLNASDGKGEKPMKFDGFSLSLTLSTPAEADKAFAALSEGGTVRMPLEKTFFSPKFGMVSDKFGINWMLMVEPKQ